MSDQAPSAARRRLVIIDGANAVYRAFFAIPNLRAPDGSPTNAIYGFVNMLGKVLREEAPDLVAVAFDPRGGTFRNRIFDGYKANRDKQPEDLSAQIPVVKEAIAAFGIELVQVEDFEADDVIATLVSGAPEDVDISIISTDKDLMQLVSDRVRLVDSVRDRHYGPAEVEERFGVRPERMLDLRSLVGDPSDNIPGVRGIGEKGAAKLINEWGSLESLLDHTAEVKAKRAREALEEQRDQALLSKELSTLRCDVSLGIELDDLATRPADVPALRLLYERLGFSRLLASLAEAGGADAPSPDRSQPKMPDVEIIGDVGALSELVDGFALGDPLALHLLCSEGSAVDAQAVGLGVCLGDDRAAYVPMVGAELAAGEGVTPGDLVEALSKLWPSGAASDQPWLAADTKQAQSVLGELGCELPAPADDLAIAAFLLDPAGVHHATGLANTELGRQLESWEEVAGRGAKAVPAAELPVDRVAGWVAGQVCALHAMMPALRERLKADGLHPLYAEVELPLTRVLSRVERAGVRIDEPKLEDLSTEYQAVVARLEEEIYVLAGERFLVSSPKQLQVILFDKLKLPAIKKTKTGYSTAESVLEQLRSHHELPGKVLEYRKLTKLMSTYIDALPPLVSLRTGRIHPHFNQLGAATGRMSASRPNVQNIPIRGEQGARIREAFIPEEGRILLSADYSQVELRILAHYSGDAGLIEAFRKREDVHRRTAAEVWGVALEDVSADQRARAKAVNFGIIYGSSAFGLANQLGIATGEAQETIDAYFERYGGVRHFLDDTIAHAKENGYVVTRLGRRRYLPDLTSRNRVLRQAAERMAVNTVIQGTAADLIKRAMVDIDRDLCGRDFRAAMILQVHDELVFEVAPTDFDALSELVSSHMVGAMALDVPLEVDIGKGNNWREAH